MRAAGMIRVVAAVLLALYALLIARLTLLPAGSQTQTFSALNDFLTSVSNGALDWTQIEVLANVALFVPAGFLLAVAVRRSWVSVVVCALTSGAIEWAQYAFLPSRVPSLADVEHNSLGGLIGAMLAWPLVRLLRRRPAPPPPTAPPAREPARAGR